MIAITTSNSTRVKPAFLDLIGAPLRNKVRWVDVILYSPTTVARNTGGCWLVKIAADVFFRLGCLVRIDARVRSPVSESAFDQGPRHAERACYFRHAERAYYFRHAERAYYFRHAERACYFGSKCCWNQDVASRTSVARF